MKFLKGLVYFLIIVYVLLCAGLYFNQEKILFQPETLPDDYHFSSAAEIDIEVEPGIHIHCLHFGSHSPKGAILYLHGNKGSNRRCRRQAAMFTGLGYDVYMPDYRGYGKSDGFIMSERQMYDDVQKVYEYIQEKYAEPQIAVLGYSIGSGMASYLAAHNSPQKLILVSAYRSIAALKNEKFPIVPSFLIKYAFDNEAHLEKVKCPIHLFHGDRDLVIPYHSMEHLKEIRPDNTQVYTLDDSSHRHSIFHNTLRTQMQRIMSPNG